MSQKKKTPGTKPTQKTEDDDTQEGQETEGSDESEGDGEDENKRINAIVTSRVKREMKGVLAKLDSLADTISKLSTSKKSEETEDEDQEITQEDQTSKEVKTDPKLARKMLKMEKELAEEREARKKAEQAQKEERERGLKQEMLGIFESALTEHGVNDPKLRKAALYMLEQEGRMVREEETGKIKFRGVDKYGMEVDFDPKVGVKGWIQSDGKSFVPSVDTGGSGTGSARQGVGNTNLTRGEYSKLSPQQKAQIELERACSGLPPLEG